MRKKITVYTDVEIDVSEYAKDFLDVVSDEDLYNEMVQREMSIPTSINEVIIDKDSVFEWDNFHRLLCTLFGVNVHTSNDELIEMVKEKLK